MIAKRFALNAPTLHIPIIDSDDFWYVRVSDENAQIGEFYIAVTAAKPDFYCPMTLHGCEGRGRARRSLRRRTDRRLLRDAARSLSESVSRTRAPADSLFAQARLAERPQRAGLCGRRIPYVLPAQSLRPQSRRREHLLGAGRQSGRRSLYGISRRDPSARQPDPHRLGQRHRR